MTSLSLVVMRGYLLLLTMLTLGMPRALALRSCTLFAYNVGFCCSSLVG